MMFNDTSIADNMACNTASALCRNAVELVYVQKSPEQDPYDIRNHALHPQAPSVLPLWLNTGEVQKAIGVDLNYTLPANREVLASFWFSSDLVRSGALADLNELLNTGIRVVLMHGDSDYVCNWNEGEDLSLAVNLLAPSDSARQAIHPWWQVASITGIRERPVVSPLLGFSMQDTPRLSTGRKLLSRRHVAISFHCGMHLYQTSVERMHAGYVLV
jgi:carboxypeptidase C (cathepsin A)